ncbi:MAG: peptidylprolyl isomerase [Proteobacteria bacterium]|nr:peptidylprolyl isomerase [Pseudomonadota bacterium]MBU1638945.1 peptidylprolyl isomerase [Pseudomonadota bacterium]
MSDLIAIFDTAKGKIKVKLFADKVPMTVASFVNLAQRGFYKELNFHRVINDFMVQGGCPLGTGTGEPGYRFEDEFDKSLVHDAPGKLSMANAGPGTNGSQFFITHIACPWLDGKHAVFGEVVSKEDMAVVNKIAQGDAINNITIEGDTTSLLASQQAMVDKWNAALDANFPHLKL